MSGAQSVTTRGDYRRALIEPTDHDAVLTGVRAALEDNGFDVEWVDYDVDHEAIVVQYATIVGGADEIRDVLTTDIPKTMGAFQGPVLAATDPDPYTELVVLVVNSRTTPAERTGKLRWEIAWEWVPGEAGVSPEEYEDPLQRVLSTAVVIDDEGTHDIDAEFEFTDTE